MGLLFTLALTYGGSVVSLFRPFYGLLIYVCFAIIRPESLWFWSVAPGNYSRIIAIALLIGWAIHGFGSWNLGKSQGILASLVLFWLWAAVSTQFCAYQDMGYGFLETKGKIILPVLVGLTLIENRNQLMQLAWTIVASQGYVAYDLNRSYYDGFNRMRELGFGGMDNNSAAIAMVGGVGLAFFLGLGERQWWKKVLAFAFAALMTHVIMFSSSRGAMLALIIVGVVSFLLIPKTPGILSLFAAGAIAALIMAGPETRERFYSTFASKEERDESAESRVEMWGICWTMMLENPITGVGPDHFPMYIHNYSGYAKGKEAHTLWLQIGAELGFPGLLFLASFYGLTVVHLLTYLRHHIAAIGEDPFIRHVPQMVAASLAGFIVAAQFVSLEGLEFPYYVALLGAGALKISSRAAEAALLASPQLTACPA